MTNEEFHKYWTLSYQNTVQISHLFKHNFSDRWFRIHSLPKSKRYADNDKDWEILLSRQNEIITDLFGLDTNILLVAGEYNWGNNRKIHITNEEEVFKRYSFTQLDSIDLYKLNPDDYDEGEIYRPAFAETIWRPNQHNKLLREIANDNTRAFFINFDKKIIVAPYDGGIDFILKDNLTRDFYKHKYKEWLSEREDGT